MSSVKVYIDEDRCVGAGQCVFAAPEVFDQRDDDGIVVLLQESVAGDQIAAAKKAARLCPALAIRVEEQ